MSEPQMFEIEGKKLRELLFVEEHYDEIVSLSALLKLSNPEQSTQNIKDMVIEQLRLKYKSASKK